MMRVPSAGIGRKDARDGRGMVPQYRRGPRALPGGGMSEAPEIVVVGAASRDLVDDDVRGWRLGGGVSYSALALARLGLRVGALVGVDGPAASADELDL